MEEGRKHIDDLFREGLEGYREMPDAAVWTSIEQRLPKRGGRRSFLWLWILLMLALLSSLGYYANRQYFINDVAQTEPVSDGAASGPHHPMAAHSASASAMQADSTLAAKQTNPDEDEKKRKGDGASAIGEEELLASEKLIARDRGNRNNSTPRQITTDQAPPQNNLVETGSDDNAIAVSGNSKTAKEEERNGGKKEPKSRIDQHRTDEPTVNKEAGKGNNLAEKNKKEAVSSPQPGNTATAGAAARQLSSANKPPATAGKPPLSTKENVASQQPVKEASPSAEKHKNSQPLQPKSENPVPVNPASATQKTAALPGEKNNLAPSQEKAAAVQKAAKTTAETQKASDPNNTALSKGKPEEVSPEKSSAKPLTVLKEDAKAAPISLQAEPNPRKSKIEVTYQDAKGSPITVEPVKEYGVRIEDAAGNNDENGTANSGSGGTGGGGTAGAEEGKTKNRIKIDGGIKLGYDRGFADVTTSNFTGNLFLQWNISPRTSLVLQPGLRYHSVNKTSLFPKDAYHQVTSESLDSAHVESDSFGIPLIQRNYIYRNSYDSISMTYAITPQKYIEIELPLLLQYKLAENFSVFGGMQLAFGKILEIQGKSQRYQGSKLDTVSFPTVFFDTTIGPPDRPALSGYFNYSTPEISELDENKYKNPVTNPARFGAMLGFSYEYKKRLLIDLLVRKNLSNLNYIPNEQVRKIYSQPYFRITVGYKLFRSK